MRDEHAVRDADAVEAPPQTRASLEAVDGLRGVGAICIAAYHFLLLFTPPPGELASYPVYAVEFGSVVTLFFVISGFTLAVVYHDAPRVSALAFMRKRAARLAPLYYASLLVSLPTFYLYTPSAATQVLVSISTLLWLQAVVLPLAQSHMLNPASSLWNAPLWQVSASALMYMLLPAALARLKAWSTRGLCYAVAALTLLDAVLVIAAPVLLPPVGVRVDFEFLHVFPLFRVPQFLVGICAGIVVLRRDLNLPRAGLTADGCTMALALSSLVVCPLVSSTGYMVPALGLPTWHLYIGVVELLVTPVHALWLTALCAPGGAAGITRRVLASRPFRLLGTLSYAIYALHMPVLYYAGWAWRGQGITAEALPEHRDPNTGTVGPFVYPAAALAPLLALIIAVAAAAHVAIENPCRALINARAGS